MTVKADPLLAYKRGAKRMGDRIRVLERQNAALKEALTAALRRIDQLEQETP